MRQQAILTCAVLLAIAPALPAQDPEPEFRRRPFLEAGLGGGLAFADQVPTTSGGTEDIEGESGLLKYLGVGWTLSPKLHLGLEASEWSPGWRSFPRLGALLIKMGYTPRAGAPWWLELGVGVARQQDEDAVGSGQGGDAEYGLGLSSSAHYAFRLERALHLVFGVGIQNINGGPEYVIPVARVGLAVR